MSGWKVTLFGKFTIGRAEERQCEIETRKVQELLGYLLLFRDHPQPRELLSEVLWGNQPFEKSRKYLRQTLWRLKSALQLGRYSFEPKLRIDNAWIQLDLPPGFWLDTAEFEKIFKYVNEKPL